MKKLLTLILVIGSSTAFGQQSNNFSMAQSSLSLLNPAATAVMYPEFRFFGNYRGQYFSDPLIPNRTNSFVFETKIAKDKLPNGWFGSGLHFVNDETNVDGTKLIGIQAYVPINYVAEVSPDTYFSVGFKPGIINRSLQTDFQTWDNQWNGIAFNRFEDPNEPAQADFTVFDMSAGIYFQTETRKEHRFNIGVTGNHLTSPDVTFTGIADNLYRQWVGHARASFKLERVRFRLSPEATAFVQGPLTYYQSGMSLDFMIREGSRRTTFRQDQTLGIGLHYRSDNTLVSTIILQLEGFEIGFAYDLDLGESSTATGGNAGMEAFLRFGILKEKRKRFIR